MNGSIHGVKAGLMSHAVKTERAVNEILRVSVARSGTRPEKSEMPIRYCSRCWKRVRFKGKFAPWNVHCKDCRNYTGRYHGSK
jgi:hypothetical protein